MSETPLGVTFEVVVSVPKPRGFYWKILDAFLEQEHPIIKVTVEGRTAHQLRCGLGQTLREQAKYVGQAKASQRGGEVYLEKLRGLKGSVKE